jgi:hypothetical protein
LLVKSTAIKSTFLYNLSLFAPQSARETHFVSRCHINLFTLNDTLASTSQHIMPFFTVNYYWSKPKLIQSPWCFLFAVSFIKNKLNPWRYRLWRTLGRLSSCRLQSFPTAPDGTGLTCGHHIESHSCIFSFPNRTVTSLFK